jgi:UDP-N-acetylglucosamine 1-carboxyvinyltransferase
VVVRDVRPEHLELVIEKLRAADLRVEVGDDRVRVVSGTRATAVDISTLPHPGFPTDLMAVAVAFLARAEGLSIITENIFDARYMFVDELSRMGADIKIEGHFCVVRGVPSLSGAPVRAADLRAGAALVVAALAADGRTVVEDIHPHIDRGYEDLHGKLSALGARISRQSTGALIDA